MSGRSSKQELTRFIGAFDPAVARQTRAVLAAMRKRLPGAVELVYDNYNALAIGFAPITLAVTTAGNFRMYSLCCCTVVL